MGHGDYIQEIARRYQKVSQEGYFEKGQYSAVLYGPAQYRNEADMLRYIQRYPQATLHEVFLHFMEITPPGLAPGDNGADLLTDDE